ncbi:MAG: disulfide bond formation protein DsbD [Rhodopirellula sp.]|nr:disulfide bond formation protein DsbD [Rhodopirellula sp.]
MNSSMQRWIPSPTRWLPMLVLLGCCWIAPAQSQDSFGGGTDLFPDFSLGGFGDDTNEPVEWRATYNIDDNGQGKLSVTATLGSGWHIYSMTQPAGGPTPTTLSLQSPPEIKLTGNFSPDRKPHSSVSSVYKGLTVEEFESSVTWSVAIQAPVGFDGKITVQVAGLVCKEACVPVSETLEATAVSDSGADAESGQLTSGISTESALFRDVAKPFRDGDYAVEWTAYVFPATVKAGQWGELIFTATPDPTYHVYETAVDDSDLSTNFVVTAKSGLELGKPVANIPVTQKQGVLPYGYFKGKVTWRIPFMVPTTTKPGNKKIEGMIAYQACTDGSCLQPQALNFKASLTIAESTIESPAAVILASSRSNVAKDAAAETKWVDPITKPADVSKSPAADDISSTDTIATPSLESGEKTETNKNPEVAGTDTAAVNDAQAGSNTAFPLILLFAFIGGLILNVMPCVLPVVGLKIMGFVSQAGEDRKRILTLNVAYVAGIMAVFALLAVVAAVTKFGWGEQFTYFPVRLGLTLTLFALALSYLDVWEIPVPGMAAGKASQDLQNREGFFGAFSKGVFATIMATPCSGPLLGFILGLTLNLAPAQTIAIFLTVGLGMSAPYLLIGFRPKLIAWLPKPGDWMVTLKQLMAFLFLGTVAFFFSQFNDTQKVPVFVSLIAVWFGCWIIGKVPNYADLGKRISAWLGGIAAATAISFGAFHFLEQVKELDWKDYNEAQLQQLRNEGKTVMVDFGAKWCVNCIVNYEVALNTATTRKVMDELGAVAMYADWTDPDEKIKQKLSELDSRSIPLLVIYPGDRNKEPIIMRDLVTQQAVVDALRRAGASVSSSSLSLSARDQNVATIAPQ